MSEISLGRDISVDVSKLLESRLLIQANSGGGKSWLLRKLLEESHDKVQQVILDLEGEFSTLRERHDYLLVSKDGDIPISIKSAKLLPRKILETNVSTIIDLSELKKHERLLFVKRFLDGLMSLPKNLWKPLLVVIDEAHQFAPEKGKSESASSVIDLATRGRKRGYCACLATQRLSKLSKDAAAECNNKLIGRTGLDVDMKRASDELGFSSKKDALSLRTLAPGEFYAFGTAISETVKKVIIGDVKTSHPKIGGRILKTSTPTPAKIKKIMEAFKELDDEADKELSTVQDYKNEVKALRQAVTKLKNTDVDREKQKAYDKGFAAGKKESPKIVERVSSDADKILDNIRQLVGTPSASSHRASAPAPKAVVKETVDDGSLSRCPRTIYTFLFQNPTKSFSRSQVSFVTGYSQRSSGFANAISELNVKGLIVKEGSRIRLGESMPELTSDETMKVSIDLYLQKMSRCPAEIFKVLLEQPERAFSKEELAELTGYSVTSSGFANAISHLNVNALIQKREGEIRLHPEIKEMHQRF